MIQAGSLVGQIWRGHSGPRVRLHVGAISPSRRVVGQIVRLLSLPRTDLYHETTYTRDGEEFGATELHLVHAFSDREGCLVMMNCGLWLVQ